MLETSHSDRRFTAHEGAGAGNQAFRELRRHLVEHREQFAAAGIDVVSDRMLIESVYRRFKERPDLTAEDIADLGTRAGAALEVLREIFGQPYPPAVSGAAAESPPDDTTAPPPRAAA